MPRVSRVKAKAHASAAQLPAKRSFAADGQVQHVLPGPDLDASLADIVEPVEAEASSSKKRLTAADLVPASLSAQPYSKSHRKRLNKKARQDLSGGHLHPLAAALAESLGQKGAEDKKARVRTKAEKDTERENEEKRKREEGKIGEGRGRTLGEKKRRDMISDEAKRRGAVMNHVQFKADPWATIRMHAGNSLAVKEAPSNNKTKGKTGKAPQKVARAGAMEIDQ